MATVKFCNEQDGSTFEPTPADTGRAKAHVIAWAERNAYEQVVFWKDGDKLWVQLGESRLNYWMPESVLHSGSSDDIEMQLDYARGAERRCAAGYGQFDK